MRVLLRQVQTRCADLEAQLNSTTRRSRKSIPKEVSLHGIEITTLGRKYAVLIAPWLDTGIEDIPQRPAIDYHSERRYVTNVANEQAAKAELFDHIPAPLRKLMGYSAFGDTVSKISYLTLSYDMSHNLFPSSDRPCNHNARMWSTVHEVSHTHCSQLCLSTSLP